MNYLRRCVLAVLSLFATGAPVPQMALSAEALKKEYERRRWQVFLAVTFGYGFFYVVRVNLSVVKKPLLDEGIFTASELGAAGSALLAVYAFGKLFNGMISDRANIGRFMAFSLFAAALINFMLGFNESFTILLLFWGLNGWFLSAGSAPSVVALSRWFSPREIGSRYGVWSCSHNIGEALTFLLTSVLVSWMGWRWGFFGPALIAVVAAAGLLRFVHDKPASLGLPPVEQYKGDESAKARPRGRVWEMQKLALKSPLIWILGLATANLYVARYGLEHWGVLYLQESKSYGMTTAGAMMGLCPIAGMLGGAVSGILSDRYFNARRNALALALGLMETAGLLLLWLGPPDILLVDVAALLIYGFAMGGLLVFLGGLMAVDFAPPEAAGAAMGMVGCFAYLGASLQDLATGFILDQGTGGRTGQYSTLFVFWIGTTVLSLLLTTVLWNAKPVAAVKQP